jgi:hypothetical protein
MASIPPSSPSHWINIYHANKEIVGYHWFFRIVFMVDDDSHTLDDDAMLQKQQIITDSAICKLNHHISSAIFI